MLLRTKKHIEQYILTACWEPGRSRPRGSGVGNTVRHFELPLINGCFAIMDVVLLTIEAAKPEPRSPCDDTRWALFWTRY